MSIAELRTELKSITKVRTILDSVYDLIAFSQSELKTTDLKTMDLSELRDLLSTAKDAIVEQYDELEDAETTVNAELKKLRRSE